MESSHLTEPSGGDLPVAFQGPVQGDFVGEFQAAAGGQTVGDAGNFRPFAGQPFGQVKTGRVPLTSVLRAR